MHILKHDDSFTFLCGKDTREGYGVSFWVNVDHRTGELCPECVARKPLYELGDTEL